MKFNVLTKLVNLLNHLKKKITDDNTGMFNINNNTISKYIKNDKKISSRKIF